MRRVKEESEYRQPNFSNIGFLLLTVKLNLACKWAALNQVSSFFLLDFLFCGSGGLLQVTGNKYRIVYTIFL